MQAVYRSRRSHSVSLVPFNYGASYYIQLTQRVTYQPASPPSHPPSQPGLHPVAHLEQYFPRNYYTTKIHQLAYQVLSYASQIYRCHHSPRLAFSCLSCQSHIASNERAIPCHRRCTARFSGLRWANGGARGRRIHCSSVASPLQLPGPRCGRRAFTLLAFICISTASLFLQLPSSPTPSYPQLPFAFKPPALLGNSSCDNSP